MDWIADKGNILAVLKKYRYILVFLALGIFLMVLPQETARTPELTLPTEPKEPALQESLGQILSQVQGAGKVRVLLTKASGEQTFYQEDEDITGETVRRNTVLVSGTGREEAGLIQRIDPPVYQGAIILCQGAENSRVCLDIVKAVKSVTGLTADRITVLKMK